MTTEQPDAQAVREQTQETARTRLGEMQADSDLAQRYLNGDPGARREMDALHRQARGMPDEPAPRRLTPEEQLQAAAEQDFNPPATPQEYRLDPHDATGHPVEIDGEMQETLRTVLLPAAHRYGIPQHDMPLIADSIASGMSYEQCERTLQQVWGADFERGLADFRAAMRESPDAALFERYEWLSNSAPLIVAIVAAYRRRQGR